MSKPPSLQWYPGDWQRDTALKMCSLAARGLWVEMLWIMFDGEPFGHLSVKGSVIRDSKLSVILGVDADECKSLLDELERFGIFSRTEDGTIYCRRLVRDHKRRETNRLNGQGGGNPILKSVKPSVGKSVNRKDNRITAVAEEEVLTQGRKERDADRPGDQGPSFSDFWNGYGKKVGRPNAEREWGKLTVADRKAVLQAMPAYVAAKEQLYRKDPERFLKHRAWEDELISSASDALPHGQMATTVVVEAKHPRPAINLAYFHPSQYTLQPDGTPYFPPGSINWRERDETGKPLEKAQGAAQDQRSGGEQGVDPCQLSIVDQGA